MSQSFTDSRLAGLVGLSAAKQLVQKMAGPSRHVHAAMFYGPKGSGKSELARALAQAWLCTNNLGEGACGECRSCGSFDRDRSADFLCVAPQPPSNVIRVSAIRPSDSDQGEPSIDEFLRTGPLSAARKAVWIADADRMNPSATNALLKMLEEPPEYGRFVLTTTSVGLIPQTIASRCVAVACELPSIEELRKLPGFDEDLVDVSDGTPGSLSEVGGRRDAFLAIRDFASRLPARGPAEALAAAEQFRKICDTMGEEFDLQARMAQARALQALARGVLKERPEWVGLIVEAHRRIAGNGYSPGVFDALFAQLLCGFAGRARVR